MISTKLSSHEELSFNKVTRLSPKRKKKTSSFDYQDFSPKNPYKKQKRKISVRTWDEHVDE